VSAIRGSLDFGFDVGFIAQAPQPKAPSLRPLCWRESHLRRACASTRPFVELASAQQLHNVPAELRFEGLADFVFFQCRDVLLEFGYEGARARPTEIPALSGLSLGPRTMWLRGRRSPRPSVRGRASSGVLGAPLRRRPIHWSSSVCGARAPIDEHLRVAAAFLVEFDDVEARGRTQGLAHSPGFNFKTTSSRRSEARLPLRQLRAPPSSAVLTV